jgi:hypothetical protein
MRSAWSVSPQTAAKDMSTVKAFFEFCLANEWLQRNPARLVKNPAGVMLPTGAMNRNCRFQMKSCEKCTMPARTKYGKQEVKWLRTIRHQRVSGEYVRYNFKWSGQDIADFISLSVYTGLRISDACKFHIDRMRPTGEIQR